MNTPEAKFWPQLDLRAPRSVPLTPVLPAAHDRWVPRQRLRFRFKFFESQSRKFERIETVYHTRIFTGGYHYNPVHTSIYGTNRAKLVPSPSTKQVHKKFHHHHHAKISTGPPASPNQLLIPSIATTRTDCSWNENWCARKCSILTSKKLSITVSINLHSITSIFLTKYQKVELN